MKAMRVSLILAGAILASGSVWSQTIQLVDVTRQANYVQTGPSSVSADLTTPFSFRAAIEGDNATTSTNPLTAATYTLPGGSATPLSFDSNNHAWRYVDTTQTSMNMLNSVYGIGGYGFDLTGTPSGSSTVTVGSFASTQLQVPLLTLSGGSWVGNSYVINAAATLTIAFNPVYTGSVGGTAVFHYDAELLGPGGNSSANDFINYDFETSSAAANGSTPPDFLASSLVRGNYTFDISYSDVQNPAVVYGSVFSASLLQYQTDVNITVIPEPANYTAVIGALALVVAVF